MLQLIRKYPLLGYCGLAYAITWSIALPGLLISRGYWSGPDLHLLEPVAAFGPFVAAMLVSRACFGRSGPAGMLKSLTRWRVGLGVGILSVLSPVALLLLALLAVALTSGLAIEPDNARLSRLMSVSGLVNLVIVGALLQAWGEEPGWRGFLLARLRERRGPLAASLVLFPVWLLWHLPFFLSRPEFGLAQWLGFSVGILSASIWLTLIWEASGSVLMALIWHAMVNICRGIALAVSPQLFLAVSNAVLLGALVIVIYWFWRSRRDSRPNSAAEAGRD